MRTIVTAVLMAAMAAGCDDNADVVEKSPGAGGSAGSTPEAGMGGASGSAGTEAGAAGAAAAAGDPYEAMSAAIEKFMAERGTLGMAAAVVVDGKLTWAKGFGSKSAVPESDPVQNTTVFPNGMLSVAATAVALLQLSDEGKLGLDAPVQDVIPELTVKTGKEWLPLMTTRHLLDQSSGISFPLDGWPYVASDENLLMEWVTGYFGENFPLLWPPGELMQWTTTGIAVQGALIERASGQYYDQYMKEKVLGPLGMTRWMSASDAYVEPDHAKAFPPAHPKSSYLRPLLGWSSVTDAARFLEFLLNGNEGVLRNELRAAMLSPQKHGSGYFDRFQAGLGTFMSPEGLAAARYYLRLSITFHPSITGQQRGAAIG
jgi:CubicO group peptidase (beta-lactamase class C family)